MSVEDETYFQHRAEVEIARAQAATSPAVVKAHYEMAEAYLGRLTAREAEGPAGS
jgi:hypothetical protein